MGSANPQGRLPSDFVPAWTLWIRNGRAARPIIGLLKTAHFLRFDRRVLTSWASRASFTPAGRKSRNGSLQIPL
jgi:hypothetical protein